MFEQTFLSMSYEIRPKAHELREARQTIEGMLESAKYVLEKEERLSVNLGYVHEDATEDLGVFGTARTSKSAEIYFNTDIESWKDNLEDLVLDVYGQAFFYENSEINFNWQQLLASVTGLMLIENVSGEKKFEKESLGQEWRNKKGSLSEQISMEDQQSFSWQLKTVLGREILQEYSLEELPNLKKSDVIEAGDRAFL